MFGKKSRKKDNLSRRDSIVVTEGASQINEYFNALKDNILYMSSGGENKVIQIESSHAGEGKTTLTCNLGVSLSFNGKKVLIIDLDFRKPRANRPFEVSNENGVVDYISNKITLEQAIKKTKYEFLDIITTGSALYNPSVLLTSDRFCQLIQTLKGMYDYILLDCPPVLQISDYIHISKVSDAVLFVVAFGQTKRSQLKEASQLIKQTGSNVIGAVMTFVDFKDPYAIYFGSYHEKNGYDE